MLDEVCDILEKADRDPHVRAMVLTGNGSAFSVGADLTGGSNSIADLVERDRRGWTEDGYREPAGRVTTRIDAMRIPVIGAINGDAVGGGATILAAADVRFSIAEAKFGFVFTRRGVSPEGASTWYLPRLVGSARAADWLLSGRVFDASEALAAGFVNAIVPDVVVAAQQYACELAATTSAQAVAVTRRMLRQPYAGPAVATRTESLALAELSRTDDCAEGVASFMDRRPAAFTSTGREALPGLGGLSHS